MTLPLTEEQEDWVRAQHVRSGVRSMLKHLKKHHYMRGEITEQLIFDLGYLLHLDGVCVLPPPPPDTE